MLRPLLFSFLLLLASASIARADAVVDCTKGQALGPEIGEHIDHGAGGTISVIGPSNTNIDFFRIYGGHLRAPLVIKGVGNATPENGRAVLDGGSRGPVSLIGGDPTGKTEMGVLESKVILQNLKIVNGLNQWGGGVHVRSRGGTIVEIVDYVLENNHSLKAASPAMSAIPPARCTVKDAQNQVARPLGAACEIDAWEGR